FDPSFCDNRVPGENRSTELGGKHAKPPRIAAADSVKDCASRKSVGAQSVQDRPVEARFPGHLRNRVQRVEVSVESVQERLFSVGWALYDEVWFSFGRVDPVCLGRRFSPKSPVEAIDHCTLGRTKELSGFCPAFGRKNRLGPPFEVEDTCD